MLQATEAIKHLTGVGVTLAGRMVLVDALRTTFHTVTLRRDPHCAACGDGASPDAPLSAPPECLPTESPAVSDSSDVYDMPATELAERLRGDAPPVLIDVREPWEHDVARIAGARLVPLDSIPAALSTFDPAQEYVIHCHHGMRSMMAAQFLKQRGITKVANLRGGISAWSDDVDPSVPQY
jgi:adenylyltransferase/sulfurtransferase